MPEQVYIAGIAIVKALLDAGVTYNDVDHSVVCSLHQRHKVTKTNLNVFGFNGTPVHETDRFSGLFTSSQFIASGTASCVLFVGLDQEQSTPENVIAVALVLVSRTFLTSHAYLKDSSILIEGHGRAGKVWSRSTNDGSIAPKKAIYSALNMAKTSLEDIQLYDVPRGLELETPQITESFPQKILQIRTATKLGGGTTGLSGLCELVWQLRGWTHDRQVPNLHQCLQFRLEPDGTANAIILSRADGRVAPRWSEVEHLRDGKERLAHNPAIQSKDISFEDWASVKARNEFVPDEVAKKLLLPLKGGDRAALARL